MENKEGIDVGDTVTVVRKIQSGTGGWNTSWEPQMDRYLNRTGVVESMNPAYGLVFEQSFYGGMYEHRYWFPFHGCKLVTKLTPVKVEEVTPDTPYKKVPPGYIQTIKNQIAEALGEKKPYFVKVVRGTEGVEVSVGLKGTIQQVSYITEDWVYFITGNACNIRTLQPATKEEYDAYQKVLLEKKKLHRPHLESGIGSVVDGNGSQIEYFRIGSFPHCCGAKEIGGLSEGNATTIDKLVEVYKLAIEDAIQNRKHGMFVINFVKKKGSKEYNSNPWRIAARKAGFKRFGKPYNNYYHDGNTISSYFYQLTQVETDNKETS